MPTPRAIGPARPIGIALRVVVALGILLTPVGGPPYLWTRIGDLASGRTLGGWGWAQLLLHGGVPILIFLDAARHLRARRHDTPARGPH